MTQTPYHAEDKATARRIVHRTLRHERLRIGVFVGKYKVRLPAFIIFTRHKRIRAIGHALHRAIIDRAHPKVIRWLRVSLYSEAIAASSASGRHAA